MKYTKHVQELLKIGEWLKINKLLLNVVKSKYMIFKNKNNYAYTQPEDRQYRY